MVYDYNINDLTACRTYRVIRCGSEVVLILKGKEGGVISAGSPTATHDDISLHPMPVHGVERKITRGCYCQWCFLSLFLHLFFPV